MNYQMTKTTDIVGSHAELTLADETPYMNYGTEFTARNKVTATTGTHGNVMLTMVAAGNMLGDPCDGESLGLANAITHMTPDEARAIAHALIIAADAVEVSA